MKKRFIKTPLVGVQVHGAKDVGSRTVNLLMGEHAGEYVRGDIMDANAVIQAFDELKDGVDEGHDTLKELNEEIKTNSTVISGTIVKLTKVEQESKDRDEVEKEARINSDNANKQAIDEEKHRAEAAETNIKDSLTAEVNRATAAENTLDAAIKAEAAKRESNDSTIKDSVAAEVARATAKEGEIQAKVNVIDGDSTTDGSFRKAIADVVGAAPEAYDTLKEIADKLNENDDLHAAINDAIATKAKATDLTAEIERAKAAEAANTAAIEAEAARAKDVESDNAQAITAEEARATNVESALNTAVETEVQRAKDQEAYLQQLIDAKADKSALNDYVPTTTLTEQVKSINDVINTKQSVEDANKIKAELTQQISTKADTDTVESYKEALATQIENEVTDRGQAIVNLTNDTNTNSAAITALEKKVAALETRIAALESGGDTEQTA